MKLIPGTKDFKADEIGNIYDSKGIKRNTYQNLDEYITCSVLLNTGKWQTFGVHRLVLLAYEYREDCNDLHVNHLNGVKNDNRVLNLEWATPEENNLHNSFINSFDKPNRIVIEHLLNNSVKTLSIKETCQIFNIDIILLWKLVKDKVEYKNCRFSYLKSNANVLPMFKKDRKEQKVRKLKSLNLETEIITNFNSLTECANYFNVPLSHISFIINNPNRNRLFKGKYLITEQQYEFNSLTVEQYKKSIDALGKQVIAFNRHNKKVIVYKSASEFIKQNNLSKKAIYVRLFKSKLEYVNDWLFCYLNKEIYNQFYSLVNVQLTSE